MSIEFEIGKNVSLPMAVKSDLQKGLESEGWRFFTNAAPNSDSHIELFTDENIKSHYLAKGFTEILVTEAYMRDGRPYPEERGVYARAEEIRRNGDQETRDLLSQLDKSPPHTSIPVPLDKETNILMSH